MDILHQDILDAINDNNKSLEEIIDIENIVDIYGSVDNFNKLIKQCSNEDVITIKEFNKIVCNYVNMNNKLTEK